MIATSSLVVRLGVRAASPPAILIGTYLLFAGHNQPGGGFAAGLVFGAVVALRTVTGLQTPAGSTALLAAGVAIICLTGLAPLAFGDALLDQKVWSVEVPLLGKIKTGSALPFDIGVTAIVVGLITATLDGLGGTRLAAAPAAMPGGSASVPPATDRVES